MTKRNKVLITGINGFIGSSLADYIKRQCPEWEVYGIDNKGDKTKKKYQIDVRRGKELKKFLLKIKPRYIFHLAGEASSIDFEQLLLSNVFSTFTLFKVIKEIERYNPRIVIPSSAAEYGIVSHRNISIKEDCLLEPVSLYGFSKMTQTNLSLFFARQGLDVVIARIFNIIGEGVPVSFSIGRFAYELALIRKKQKLPRLHTKSLDVQRDFLDIHDICAYLVILAVNGRKGEVYNLCRGKSYSIRYLLNKIINISGLRDIEIKEDSRCNGERNHGDSCGSAKKIRSIAKGIKLTPIERSLEAVYKYYLKRI